MLLRYWRYLWWAVTAVAVVIAAIVVGNLWLLNFIHVFSSLLWTGIDLFMGFVLGPICGEWTFRFAGKLRGVSRPGLCS
jgi:hypothetical protein